MDNKFQTLVLNITLENFHDFMRCNTSIWNPRHKMPYSNLYNFCFTRQYSLFRITRFLNFVCHIVLFLSMIMIEQKRHCTYKITLFYVQVTIVTTETKQCVLCVLFRHITVNNIMTLSVAQKCSTVNLCYWQLLKVRRFSCQESSIPVCF